MHIHSILSLVLSIDISTLIRLSYCFWLNITLPQICYSALYKKNHFFVCFVCVCPSTLHLNIEYEYLCMAMTLLAPLHIIVIIPTTDCVRCVLLCSALFWFSFSPFHLILLLGFFSLSFISFNSYSVSVTSLFCWWPLFLC